AGRRDSNLVPEAFVLPWATGGGSLPGSTSERYGVRGRERHAADGPVAGWTVPRIHSEPSRRSGGSIVDSPSRLARSNTVDQHQGSHSRPCAAAVLVARQPRARVLRRQQAPEGGRGRW